MMRAHQVHARSRQATCQPHKAINCLRPQHTSRVVAHCTSTTTASTPVSSRLSGEAAATWSDSLVDVQTALNIDQDVAEKFLERAFGWGSQAYWRNSKVEEVPRPDQVSDVLAYLSSLGLSGDDLLKVVKAFPEVLACSVQEQLQTSVSKLEGEWKLKGDVLTRTLARRPQVLGYSLDCEGSCIGECNRCWARF